MTILYREDEPESVSQERDARQEYDVQAIFEENLLQAIQKRDEDSVERLFNERYSNIIKKIEKDNNEKKPIDNRI